MKRKILIFAALFLSISAYSQEEEDQWLNKTSFNTTENCPDSINCYTEVVVEINHKVIPDSVQLSLKIGSTYGADDIYSRKLQNVPSVYSLPGVEKNSAGNIVVSLGEYMVGENFYVDLFIE